MASSEPGGGLSGKSKTFGARERGAVPWDLELPRRQMLPQKGGRNPCLRPSSPLTFHQC